MSNAELVAAGHPAHPRIPRESYDTKRWIAVLDAVTSGDAAAAPVYSHLRVRRHRRDHFAIIARHPDS